MSAPFAAPRDAALAVLVHGQQLNRKCGQFLGTIAVQDDPITPAQRKWLDDLLRKNGLPPLQGGDHA